MKGHMFHSVFNESENRYLMHNADQGSLGPETANLDLKNPLKVALPDFRLQILNVIVEDFRCMNMIKITIGENFGVYHIFT